MLDFIHVLDRNDAEYFYSQYDFQGGGSNEIQVQNESDHNVSYKWSKIFNVTFIEWRSNTW